MEQILDEDVNVICDLQSYYFDFILEKIKAYRNYTQDDIEDEFHYILKCPTYQNFRSKYIKSYYRTRPSVFKLVQLLSMENVKELCNLGKFLINTYELRENLNSVKAFQASLIYLTIFLYYYLCNIYTIVMYTCICTDEL